MVRTKDVLAAGIHPRTLYALRDEGIIECLIYLAISRNAEAPRIDHPPMRIFWFAGKAFSEGIETHRLDGVPVRIYNREKTLVDCFKYRNKIGMDTVLEALRRYREQSRIDVQALMRYAEIRRVKDVMRPYLEAVL